MEEIKKIMDNNLGLSTEQMKAVKAVERAMKRADVLGVGFWADYTNLSAYNNKTITMPVPDENREEKLSSHEGITYSISSPLIGGNADDDLYFDVRRKP